MSDKIIDKDRGITAAACFDKIATNKRGRPSQKLNEVGQEIVFKLAQLMCTEEEIASVLDVTVETLHNKENEANFSECVKKGREQGKSSLRRIQFGLAKKNAAMAIWLGKQYLGQKDSLDVKAESEANDKVTMTINFKDFKDGD